MAATRLARFVEAEAKTYLAAVRLGFATDTDDRTGTPLGPPAELGALDLAAVTDAVGALAGAQQQRPPRYSAKHVEGQRSYRLARRGITVELAEASIVVHRIELVSLTLPELVFRATVSAGTYVRALARDLGERLGVGGHLSALRREAIGTFRVEDAVPLDRVDAAALRPAWAVLGHLSALELDIF